MVIAVDREELPIPNQC